MTTDNDKMKQADWRSLARSGYAYPPLVPEDLEHRIILTFHLSEPILEAFKGHGGGLGSFLWPSPACLCPFEPLKSLNRAIGRIKPYDYCLWPGM